MEEDGIESCKPRFEVPNFGGAVLDPRIAVDTEVTCSNPHHPDGPWHLAEGMSLKWRIRLVHWIRTLRWGCSCPKKVKN